MIFTISRPLPLQIPLNKYSQRFMDSGYHVMPKLRKIISSRSCFLCFTILIFDILCCSLNKNRYNLGYMYGMKTEKLLSV